MSIIKLRSLSHTIRADLPYIPTMPAWEYLRNVIVPRCHGMVFMDEGGLSTQGGLVQHYHDVSDGERYNFVFDYASRLDLIGDVLPPDATVTVSLYYCDREKRMYGNCSKEDVRTECPICLCNESYTDVELHCGHRFHDLCLANMRKMVCPLCRAPISDEDKTKIYADLIVTDEDGVVVHLDGTFAIV